MKKSKKRSSKWKNKQIIGIVLIAVLIVAGITIAFIGGRTTGYGIMEFLGLGTLAPAKMQASTETCSCDSVCGGEVKDGCCSDTCQICCAPGYYLPEDSCECVKCGSGGTICGGVETVQCAICNSAIESCTKDALTGEMKSSCEAPCSYFACALHLAIPNYNVNKKNYVILFVDSATYNPLKYEIKRLKDDIEKDSEINVFIASRNKWKIQEIKVILQYVYEKSGLIGAILIGNIPTAYFEYNDKDNGFSDWYFEDLSNEFVDEDKDGKFERENRYMAETDITMRDIWIGRLKPPVGGEEGRVLLKNYLDNNHDFRTGKIKFTKKMFFYSPIFINDFEFSEEEYLEYINQIPEYTGFYDSNSEIDYIYSLDPESAKQEYLFKISSNFYDFSFINAHGVIVGHCMAEGVCVPYWEIKESEPKSLFTVLATCSNGYFEWPDYLAGWYLFSGQSLVMFANTNVDFQIGAKEIGTFEEYLPLNLGVSFGEMHKHDTSFLVRSLFGDPTLTFREKPTENIPLLSLEIKEIDFGEIKGGEEIEKKVLFKNEGNAALEVIFRGGYGSINKKEILHYGIDTWAIFEYYYYGDSPHHRTRYQFKGFEIEAGEEKEIIFVFEPQEDWPNGDYSMIILFQTNDPETPYLKIQLSGKATS